MEKKYWTMFWLTLIGLIIFIILLIAVILLSKKVFLVKRYGVFMLVFYLLFILFMIVICLVEFIRYYKDFDLASRDYYIEDVAIVTEFTLIQRDSDGNGKISYRKPKFYIKDKDEYIVLYINEVEVGKTYLIRYYPNARFGEIVKRISD